MRADTADFLSVTATVPAKDRLSWTTFNEAARKDISAIVDTVIGAITAVNRAMLSPSRASPVAYSSSSSSLDGHWGTEPPIGVIGE